MAEPTERPSKGEPGRSRFASVRIRILGWYAILMGLSLVVGLLLQRTLLLNEVLNDAELAMDQEVEEMRQLAGGTDPETGEPFGDDVRAIFDIFFERNVALEGEGFITFIDDNVYKTDVNGALVAMLPEARKLGALPEPERGEFDDPELGAIRYLAVPLIEEGEQLGVFAVTVFLESRYRVVNDTIRLGGLVYGSVFLVATSLAWVVAGRILHPLADLRRTARSITETDLSRRIEVKGDDEIARLGRTFNAMLDRLDQAFATQRRFVDDAGHELRTPITVIRGNLELMGDNLEERAETVALLTAELDRMTRIVNDLLDLAKAEQPDFIQVAPVDLADFTKDLATRAHALDKRPWHVEMAEQAVFAADEDRLNQAMINLIRNAAEHSPPGTPVFIGGGVVNGSVRLWVRDQGETIPPEQRERIFDRFSRVGDGRRNTDGAGLGLAIVSAIAKAHGGTVSVDEPREGGNSFTIKIPLALESEQLG